MYTCELCNFNSPSKSNYEKHCQTQKHKKNIAKQSTASPITNADPPIETKQDPPTNTPPTETKKEEEPCNKYTIPDPPKYEKTNAYTTPPPPPKSQSHNNSKNKSSSKTTSSSTEYSYEYPPYDPLNPDANTFPFAPPDLEELIRQFIPYGLNAENIRTAFESMSNSHSNSSTGNNGYSSKSSSRSFPFKKPFSKSNEKTYSYSHTTSSSSSPPPSNPFKFNPPPFYDDDEPSFTSSSYPKNASSSTSSSTSSTSSTSSSKPTKPTKPTKPFYNTNTSNLGGNNTHTTHSTLNMPVFGNNDIDLGSFSDNPFGSRNISISSEAPMPDDVIQELLQKKEITQLAPEKQSYLKKMISDVCKTKNIITTNNTKTTTTNNTTVTTRSNNEFTLNIFMNNECRLRIDITELAMSIIGQDTNIMDNIPEYLNTIIKVLIPIIIQMIRDREFDI